MAAVLVTGATGLIGRRVVEELANAGRDIVALDRRIDARMSLVPRAIREQVAWHEGDTRDYTRLRSAMEGVDAVIHLAAGASFLMYEELPLAHTAGTIEGFHNVLEAAVDAGVETVVYASTSAVYEGNEVPYRETMLLRPPDLKAFSKKVNEEMADIYADRYGVRTLALRPFSVYGEDEMSKGKYANVISLFTWAMSAGRTPIVWGDGAQTRDFIHSSDVARAFVLAVGAADGRVRAVNVGTGVETSFNDLIDQIARSLEIEVEPVYVPTPISIYATRLLADVSLSQSVLGFTPRVSLESGVRRVVDAARTRRTIPEWEDLAVAQTVVLNERGHAF
jgi:nucleoside-diphosphate-sugar epimerase